MTSNRTSGPSVLHVVPSIAEEAAGPSHTVPGLSGAQRRQGAESLVVALGDPTYSSAEVRLFRRRRSLERLGWSPEMRRWLQEQVEANPQLIIHNHSLWMLPNIYPGLVTRNGSALQVVSPRGTLSTWAFNSGSRAKKVIWPIQRRAIAECAGWHATSAAERDEIRALGFGQPIAVVPNGVDMPELTQREVSDRRSLVYFGRIHPKKGIDLLLRSWRELERSHPDWDLVIAGPDNNGYLAEMHQLAAQLSIHRCSFVGPRYGQEKWELLQGADLFVLPSHSENFGVAVAEALAAGVPVVAARGTPWEALPERHAGWWTDLSELTSALDGALRCPPERLREMGLNGRRYAERAFGWDSIGQQLLDFYEWLQTGGAEPGFVYG